MTNKKSAYDRLYEAVVTAYTMTFETSAGTGVRRYKTKKQRQQDKAVALALVDFAWNELPEFGMAVNMTPTALWMDLQTDALQKGDLVVTKHGTHAKADERYGMVAADGTEQER